jgi:hypothetical protein
VVLLTCCADASHVRDLRAPSRHPAPRAPGLPDPRRAAPAC